MINELIKLSNHLDAKGLRREADYLDSVIRKIAKEAGHDHNEDSSYMAKPQLIKIKEYSSKLYDMMEDDESLSDWMETYIAQMDHMMGAVYHSYKHSGGHYEKEKQDDHIEQVQVIQDIAGDVFYD